MLRQSGQSSADDLEPLSPELALVDPELRTRARAELRLDAGVLARPDDPGDAVSPDADPNAHAWLPRYVRRPRVRRAIVGLTATALAIGLLSLRDVRHDPAPKARAAVTAAAARGPERDRRSVVPPRAGASARAALPRARGPARHAAAPARRTFVWPPVPGADYYDVRFLRGRRVVFAATRSTPRLVVRLRERYRGRAFRFGPGRYRWLVRPGHGARGSGRLGAPVVVSTWTVPRRR